MPPRRRVVLWVVGMAVYAAVLVPAGTLLTAFMLFPPWGEEGPAGWLEGALQMLGDEDWWASALPVCAIIAVTQFAFVVPVVRLRPPLGTRPRSLTTSLVLGGVVAAVLTSALGLAVAELLGGLVQGDQSADPWSGNELLGQSWAIPGFLVMLVGSWLLWTMLLMIFARNLWADTVLGRLVVLLFGGTIVELLVVVPVDVMVRRRSDCYCASGTFWSLCISAVGLLWLAGPGVVVAVTARRRRLARRTHCAGCGHPKGPSPGPRCPECGYEWQEGA